MLKNELVIRSDNWGSGFFGSPRGSRIHEGVDFVVEKGQNVYAPEAIKVVRVAYPYASDLAWKGLLFIGLDTGFSYKVFYFAPILDLIGTVVSKGTLIGHAQSINDKYNTKEMIPHIHVEMRKDDILHDASKYLKPLKKKV